MGEQMTAAVGASAAVSIVATPTELMKCRLQAQGCSKTALAKLVAAGVDPRAVRAVGDCVFLLLCLASVSLSLLSQSQPTHTHTPTHHKQKQKQKTKLKAVVYRGPLDVARRVLRFEGGVHGLYKGGAATMARESVGNIAMFGTYEAVKAAAVERRGLSSASQLPTRDVMLAGGLGGLMMWVIGYPIDVVKSKVQLDSYEAPRYRGMWDCARQVIAQDTWRGLYRGYGPALLRSFPANAVCFGAYEAAHTALGGRHAA